MVSIKGGWFVAGCSVVLVVLIVTTPWPELQKIKRSPASRISTTKIPIQEETIQPPNVVSASKASLPGDEDTPPTIMTAPQPRVAVLIPFMGCLPPWWEITLYSMQINSGIADFHFFFEKGDCDNEERRPPIPLNVELYYGFLPEPQTNIFFHTLEEVGLWKVTQETLRDFVSLSDLNDVFYKRPHKMTDFKPFYGDIFMPLLKKKEEEGVGGQNYSTSSYTHWAWSDTDLIFGRLDKFLLHPGLLLEDKQERTPDVIAFNDQRDELFLGGQLCFFKINSTSTTNTTTTQSLWKRMDKKRLSDQLRDWKTTYSVDERLFSYAMLQDPEVSVSIVAAMIADDRPSPLSYRDLMPFWKEGKILVLNVPSPLLSSSSSSSPSSTKTLTSSTSENCMEDNIEFPSNGLIFPGSQPRIKGEGRGFFIHSRAAGTKVWCRQEMPQEEVRNIIGQTSGQSFFEAAFYHFYLGKKNIDEKETRKLVEEEMKEALMLLEEEGQEGEEVQGEEGIGICRIDIHNNLEEKTFRFSIQRCPYSYF